MKKYILHFVIILLFAACEKEQSLTPNSNFDPSTNGTNNGANTGNNNGGSSSGGGGGSSQSSDRFINATINGTDYSIIREDDQFNFSQPRFITGYNLSCTGDCVGSSYSGLSEQNGGVSLEIEFFHTFSIRPPTEEDFFRRITVGSYSYKLNEQNNSPGLDVDSVIVRFTDGNKIWLSETSPLVQSSQVGSNFSIDDVIVITETSFLTFEEEKDNFLDSLPSIIIRGKFNCNLYDDNNNSMVLKDGEFSLKFNADL